MYQIVIPTLSRVNILQTQTLKTLQHHNISKSQITIFCIDKEYDQYKNIFQDYKIVVGELGLIKQKEFIQTYYPVDTNILFLDDDIQEIDLDNFNSLDELIVTGFNECRNRNSYIWSIYPVWNKYFRQTKSYLSTSLKFCIGAFTGIINRKDNPKINCCHREDVERTIKYFMRDGIVLRFNRVGYKTKFYNEGGLGLLKDRLQIIEQDVKYISQVYNMFGTVNEKKEYLDFKLKNIPANTPIQIPIDPSELSVLYDMLEQISIPLKNKTNNRRGFPVHRACTFGITKGRFNGKTDLSRMTKKYPHIYDEICRIGNLFSFQFTSIHCNHNVICPKHKDEKNVGNSLLLSFGNYGEGSIIIDEKKYDANCCGIIFNGSLLEHYNEEHAGNKYSLVFYNF
jgi:hypothetical protein